MSTAPTLPTVPPLPANATWDQQMRHAEALQRNAHISATIRLAEAQEAARLVMIRQAEAAEQMLVELQAQPPAAPESNDSRALTVVAALLGESDKPAPEVLASVQGRIQAAGTLLGG